jgi:hypothetical protein
MERRIRTMADKQGDSGTPIPEIVIEVDGEKKAFKADDVSALVAEHAAAAERAAAADKIVNAAKGYNLTPEQYLGHSEGAFQTLSKLQEDGVIKIDDEGKVIVNEKKTPVEPEKPSPVTGHGITPELQAQLDKLAPAVDALTEIQKKVERLEGDQTGIMRESLSRRIMEKHSSLDNSDVAKLLSVAMKDQTKDIWGHAEELVETKKQGAANARAQYAKEFGIDLVEFDANKVREQDAKGGGGVAASVVKGKKISFDAKKSDTNAVTPRQAALEYLTRVEAGG